LIAERQKKREDSFQHLRKQYPLDEDSEKILSLTTDELLEELQMRVLTASEVLKAFIAKVYTKTTV